MCVKGELFPFATLVFWATVPRTEEYKKYIIGVSVLLLFLLYILSCVSGHKQELSTTEGKGFQGSKLTQTGHFLTPVKNE